MEPMVISQGDRGGAIHVRQPESRRSRLLVLIPGLFVFTTIVLGPCVPGVVFCQTTSSPASPSSTRSAQQSLMARDPERARGASPHTKVSPISADAVPPPSPEPTKAAVSAVPTPAALKRFKVRDEYGECFVARFHGQYEDKTALLLPDGQLGTPNRLIPTDEPFQPLTADQLESRLRKGPFAEYHVLKTSHYLIFYKSTLAFAQDSGRLLDDLYKGLMEAFRRNGFPVHDTEFPLVAVIFATESDFRAHKKVDPQVQAYYEFGTNRILFYQKSERDLIEPKLAALLKPQTVAHEGAHQILSNIGLQPRPCAWPPWLVEGLAEYCATTVNSKKGDCLARHGRDQLAAHGHAARAR